MRPLSLVVLFLLMVGAMLASAREEAKDPSYAKQGDLEAYLVVTNEGDELLAEWARGAPRLTIESIDAVERGEFITVIVRFLGCQADPSGHCQATVDYVAYRPDGAVYGEMHKRELWLEKPAPSPGASQLAVEYMGLVIEPADPNGEYKVVATVHDHNAGQSVTVWRVFEVSGTPSMPGASSAGDSLDRWVHSGR